MSHADVLSAVMEKGGPTPEYRNFVEFCSHFESASDPRVATSVERSVAVRKVSMAELQEGSLIKVSELVPGGFPAEPRSSLLPTCRYLMLRRTVGG